MNYLLLFAAFVQVGLAYRMYADHPVSYEELSRNDYCDIAASLKENPSLIKSAFSGREVLVGVDAGTDPAYFAIDNTTFQPSGGLMYYLNQEIESRGNFTFVYAVIPRTQSATTARLVEQLPHVDIITSTWYSHTTARRLAHIGFTQPVVDASLILVTVQVNPSIGFDPWQFLQPYDGAVWGTVLALCVVNALLNWGIEGKFTRKARNDGENYNYFSATVESFNAISGSGTADSAAHPASRYLSAGFGFFFLVFGAGYTANLASYLTQRPQSAPLLASPQDAQFQHASICVQYGSAAYTSLSVSSTYNHYRLVTNEVNGSTIPGVMAMLREGQCEGAVISQVDWLTHEMIAENDPDCEFTVVGDPLLTVGGSYTYWPDTKYNCTSTVEDVISYIIIGMQNDGTMDSIVANYVTEYGTTTCPATVDENNPSSALTTSDMAGVFFIYLIFVGMAVAYKLLELYVLPVEEEEAVEGEEINKENEKEIANSRADDKFKAQRTAPRDYEPVSAQL